MDGEANNTRRIGELERAVPRLEASIEVVKATVEERTMTIISSINDLKDAIQQFSAETREMAISHAQNLEKWASYERDKARMETEIKEVKQLASSNQLSLAKIAGVGGGSGAAVYLLIELIKWFITKQP